MTCLSNNMRAFLMMIRTAEGTAGPDGYRTLFGGGLFEGFEDHPRQRITRKLGGTPITSSAAGAYQFLERTWDEVQAKLDLPDFSPNSQDRGAVELIRRRGALKLVEVGHFEQAVEKVRKEWASMPGAGYSQPEKKLAFLQEVYEDNGGTIA